ncbi:MAG TPA: type II toxin-antitoxin system ParD family antitoxin [Beijerinckiaceae bacterium]
MDEALPPLTGARMPIDNKLASWIVGTIRNRIMATFSLGPHFEAFVREQVASGRYNNASEVVREGLKLVEEREAKLARLRKDIQEGLESGGDFSEEDLRAHLAELVAEAERQGL